MLCSSKRIEQGTRGARSTLVPIRLEDLHPNRPGRTARPLSHCPVRDDG
jgi:hypothetical protein